MKVNWVTYYLKYNIYIRLELLCYDELDFLRYISHIHPVVIYTHISFHSWFKKVANNQLWVDTYHKTQVA